MAVLIRGKLILFILIAMSTIAVLVTIRYAFSIKGLENPFKRWKYNGAFQTRFAFVLQTEECMPNYLKTKEYFGDHTFCECDVYVLSFKKPCESDKTANLPHVSYIYNNTVKWSAGRNLALSEARKRRKNYLYYIIMDDDIELHYNDFTPKEYVAEKIPPLKIFTSFLKDYQPAGAGPEYEYFNLANEVLERWHSSCKKTGIPAAIPIGHLDALFVAFHRNVVDTVLPYPENYDVKTHWLSTIQVTLAFQIAFHGQLAYFPQLIVTNPKHRIPTEGKGPLISDMNIRREMVENIRRRAPQQYKEHPFFEAAYNYPVIDKTHTLCMDPQPPRSLVVPYRVMPTN